MAINTFEKSCDKIVSKYASHNSRENLPASQMNNLASFTDDSFSGSDSRSNKTNKRKNAKSPYLANDNVHLHSRIKEKKVMHKRATNALSSFPLAVNIYKANSDEFKSQKKGFKKVKKSVLTLPNEPATIPQTCTVSDMNDSEYLNTRDGNKKLRVKKRLQAQKGKTKNRNKDYEFYDRDARFCSQMNLDLNCSSSDMIKFTGDGKRATNKYRSSNKFEAENDLNAHDVWAVLRNINRFQFTPSPPMSDDDSIHTPAKKKIRSKRRNNPKERRIIETCCTEQFAYISSFDFDSHTFSQSSSFDRITVIDKQEEVNEICHELENKTNKRRNLKGKTRNQAFKNQNKNIMKSNIKAITHKETSYQMHRFNENKIDKTKADIITGNGPRGTTYNNKTALDSGHEIAASDNTKKENFKQENECGDVATVKPKVFSDATLSDSLNGSCKADTIKSDDNRDDIESLNVPSYESEHHIKGITKVVLCKGRSTAEPKRNEVQKRKPRLLTTMPSTAIMPRLTTTEIKRRLANMKFPIIILGKDQLGATSIQVTKHDYPQFDGLVQRIWPFMQDWYESNLHKHECASEKKGKPIEPLDERKVLTKNKTNIPKGSKGDSRNIKSKITEKKTSLTKHLNLPNTESLTNRKKNLKISVPPYELTQDKQQPPKREKPMQRLQDTMLRFLYRKASVKSLDEQFKTNVKNNFDNIPVPQPKIQTHINNCQKVDVSTETLKIHNQVNSASSKAASIKASSGTYKLTSITKRRVEEGLSLAKGKWASEFIENVMRKIRNGVYYNHENICPNKTLPLSSKEVSIQTLTTVKNISTGEETFVNIKEEDNFNDNKLHLDVFSEHTKSFLPGFDKTPTELEINNWNTKEISIRHCTTNVMVQFDVAYLLESEYRNRLLKSSSFIPLAINESHTKIFKCKTTLLNAVLPAELCSIIPTVLTIIIDSTKQPTLPAIKPYQKDTNLYTISELLRNDNSDIPKCTLPAVIGLSPNIKRQFESINTYYIISKKATRIYKPRLEVDFNIRDLFPMIHNIQLVLPIKVNPRNLLRSKLVEVKPDRTTSTCTALQLYQPPQPYCGAVETNLNSTSSKCTIKNLLKQMWNQDIIIRFKISMPLSFMSENNKIFSIRMKSDTFEHNKENSSTVSNLQISSLYSSCRKHNKIESQVNVLKEWSMGTMTENNNLIVQKADKKDSQTYMSSVKTRKKSFVKLYKKCKSTSNIFGEKYSTPLHKITNLDDFFQVLGSAKMMSSVFDGNIGKKILSSVSEMKNWITDISQRQAMLVLLLANKKDTSNLVRFRALLLQGIAVNRITRASELDMEIEVIEKENFNHFSQFEGISYALQTTENSDNLLEELVWIAKTTASDYQKPFNESSEKLLKFLLEKRKKLNPSYLRVMARYVGLGLLKTPRKKP